MATFAPSFSTVVWSAFRTRSCRFVSWRPSAHSPTGRVAVAYLADMPAAGKVARYWSRLIGYPVSVRRSPYSWSVSVPISTWAPLAASGQLLMHAGDTHINISASLRAVGFRAE